MNTEGYIIYKDGEEVGFLPGNRVARSVRRIDNPVSTPLPNAKFGTTGESPLEKVFYKDIERKHDDLKTQIHFKGKEYDSAQKNFKEAQDRLVKANEEWTLVTNQFKAYERFISANHTAFSKAFEEAK